MALTKLICPHCKLSMKPPKPVPEGTKLRCPKCKQGFAAGQAPADDDLRIPVDDDDAPKKKGEQKGIVEDLDRPAARNQGAADAIDVLDLLDDTTPSVKKKGKEPPRKGVPEKKAEQKPEPKPVLADDDEGNDAAGTYGLAAGEEDEAEEEAPRGKKGGKEKEKKKKKEMSFEPDMAPKDPRGPAQEQVIVCTNYMLLSAIVGFFGYLALIVVIMIPAVTPITTYDENKAAAGQKGPGAAQPPAEGADKKKEAEKPSIFTVFEIDMAKFRSYGIGTFLLILLPLVLGMVYSSFIAFGSVQAQSMESRAWGIAGGVMTILSYQMGGAILLVCWAFEILFVGILGSDTESLRMIQYAVIGGFIAAEIAAGTWVVKTLLKEDVKEGFEYKPE